MPALELTLPQIAALEADGTIAFYANRISTIAAAPQAFMIFYLTQQDEQNGYGTVIQLDQQHQAFIYPDLNPEYTYLFFQNEQGFQTLLWCIEFATRTEDGLYVTQAKVHGRGVTEADMQRFSQIMLPTQPAAEPVPAPTPAQPVVAPVANPILPSDPAVESIPAPVPAVEPVPDLSVSNSQPAPISSGSSASNVSAMPDLLAPIDTPSLAAATPSMPQPTIDPLPPITPPVVGPQLDLPPLPEVAPLEPTQPMATVPLPDLPPLPPLPSLEPTPTPLSQPANPPTTTIEINQAEAVAKNPVGRPPKPLLSDNSWVVDQVDFSWAKNVSRENIATIQTELRQKVEQQIQRNQPDLLTNSVFMAAFDNAFTAVCQTYDLIPTARQDLLKSLLNGRMVENLLKNLPT